MPSPSKRLELLEKMIESGNADSFAHYALAMEYRKENRPDDALRMFSTLRGRDPEYLPMYLMTGQICVAAARWKEAGDWLQAGIALAKAKGNHQALAELEAELTRANADGVSSCDHSGV